MEYGVEKRFLGAKHLKKTLISNMYCWQISYCIAKHYRNNTAYLTNCLMLHFIKRSKYKKLTFFSNIRCNCNETEFCHTSDFVGRTVFEESGKVVFKLHLKSNYNPPKEQYILPINIYYSPLSHINYHQHTWVSVCFTTVTVRQP
jgi:hypothetical protein